MSTKQRAVVTINDFIQHLQLEKAADGTTPLSEPGSIGGETTHPVKKVDDRLQKAKEGDRSAENTADVKKDQGTLSVENAGTAKAASSLAALLGQFAKSAEGGPVSTGGSAAADHISTTTKVAPTGEDPANETNSAKAGKEDKKQGDLGGTSHPASTENDKLDGHKYAGLNVGDMSLEKLAAVTQEIGNNLLTAIVQSQQNVTQKTAQASPPARQAVDPQVAFLAGNELAGLLAGNFDKAAADRLVTETLGEIIKTASDDADAYIAYAQHWFKTAEPTMPEDPAAAAMPPGGGGMPGGMAEGGMGGGGDGGASMLSALGGGEGAGDGDGDEHGSGGGMDVAQLMQILEAAGVTPEQLQKAMAEQSMGDGGAGGGATPPPAGGGMPPEGGMEVQAAAKHATKSAEMTAYLQELIKRSRKS